MTPVETVPTVVRSKRNDELVRQEINGSKALLMEIIRRAAYDWVLYRSSDRLAMKQLAQQAYNWLFVEELGTVEWAERQREGKHITSFVSICESLELDPDTVRGHVRRLTAKHVMSVGRPAEYRRRDVFASGGGNEDVHSLPASMASYTEDSAGTDDGPVY
jgi:hypothetical protein